MVAIAARSWREPLTVSSSFPAARFPALPLSKERETADLEYNDTAGASTEPSDEALIERIRDGGNEEAVGLLFRRYARLVWCIAQQILRDRGEAEDVMQEVFLMVHQKTSIFDASKGPARTLIVYMTYRLAYKRRRYLSGRHAHYSSRLNDSAADLTAVAVSFYDESIEAHFGREGLRNALADLSEAQRETLRLYFFEGYALNEIASKLGESLGNVRHHYFRGLDRLRKYLPGKGQ
jgi:RNA polymerase sigma-70 factor, ECF subfamily